MFVKNKLLFRRKYGRCHAWCAVVLCMNILQISRKHFERELSQIYRSTPMGSSLLEFLDGITVAFQVSTFHDELGLTWIFGWDIMHCGLCCAHNRSTVQAMCTRKNGNCKQYSQEKYQSTIAIGMCTYVVFNLFTY
jgi:hypothetical protein